LGAGCDGRFYADDERHGADGEVVSFWRPDAGVKLAAMLPHRANDGDKKARSPGRARRKPLKPFARGMPDENGVIRGDLLVCFSFFAREAAGASIARHSLRP